MKLATERTAHPDGRLLVVSRDLQRAVPATSIARNLQDALDRWKEVSAALQTLYDLLNFTSVEGQLELTSVPLAAPLPRAWQWLDASAFDSHGELMQRAFNMPPIERTAPLMYQGMSHQFLGPNDDVCLPSESDDIDFEGEFGVITSAVPMGTSAADALHCVRLVVQINDWSLRKVAPIEMKTGFGWIQAKPACSAAPIALTPDELQESWRDGRVIAALEVRRHGELFGRVTSEEMSYGFHELIAHAARTRMLCAGTIIGSGTVSSKNYRQVGSCCIAERRAIEMIDRGAAATSFLRFGERVEMAAWADSSVAPLFGALCQTVVRAG